MAVRFDRIEELRKERDMTESELLAETGQSPNNFSRWKKGTSQPSYASILKIANYFNVDVRYLLGFTDSPYNEDYVEKIKDDLEDLGVEITSTDNDNGAGQEWSLSYGDEIKSYLDHEFKSLCFTLYKKSSSMEQSVIKQWFEKAFNTETISVNLTMDELNLITKYRKLSEDGKIIVESTIISELRRMG